MAWRGLACLFPTLTLLAEFILSTEATHVLLANFPEPVTLFSQKLHKWKRALNRGSFCQRGIKIRVYSHGELKSEDTQIQGKCKFRDIKLKFHCIWESSGIAV